MQGFGWTFRLFPEVKSGCIKSKIIQSKIPKFLKLVKIQKSRNLNLNWMKILHKVSVIEKHFDYIHSEFITFYHDLFYHNVLYLTPTLLHKNSAIIQKNLLRERRRRIMMYFSLACKYYFPCVEEIKKKLSGVVRFSVLVLSIILFRKWNNWKVTQTFKNQPNHMFFSYKICEFNIFSVFFGHKKSERIIREISLEWNSLE